VTCCVACLCDNRKAIILAADKMITWKDVIESEPDIHKISQLTKDWWIMFSGDDIAPVFDVIDRTKKDLSRRKALPVDEVIETVERHYFKKRMQLAESVYLTPRGLTIEQFNSPAPVAPASGPLRPTIEDSIQSYTMPVSLLVAGFDNKGQGHIFSLEDQGYGGSRGSARRHDIPGFQATGSGSIGANYIMTFRKVSPSLRIREALYFVAEGKYYGEFAGGVGLRTDIYILRPGRPKVKIKEEAVDKKLMRLCDRLGPRDLDRKGIEVLNSFGGRRMDTIPKLQPRAAKTRKVATKV
jgi:20S proteasome alpha/beta subunit